MGTRGLGCIGLRVFYVGVKTDPQHSTRHQVGLACYAQSPESCLWLAVAVDSRSVFEAFLKSNSSRFRV